jgi:hypothetical protein
MGGTSLGLGVGARKFEDEAKPIAEDRVIPQGGACRLVDPIVEDRVILQGRVELVLEVEDETTLEVEGKTTLEVQDEATLGVGDEVMLGVEVDPWRAEVGLVRR